MHFFRISEITQQSSLDLCNPLRHYDNSTYQLTKYSQIILLHDLLYYLIIDHVKIRFVHVLTCVYNNFNTTASVCDQNKSCVFVSHIVESVIRIYGREFTLYFV